MAKWKVKCFNLNIMFHVACFMFCAADRSGELFTKPLGTCYMFLVSCPKNHGDSCYMFHGLCCRWAGQLENAFLPKYFAPVTCFLFLVGQFGKNQI